jgi:hypothetical protein
MLLPSLSLLIKARAQHKNKTFISLVRFFLEFKGKIAPVLLKKTRELTSVLQLQTPKGLAKTALRSNSTLETATYQDQPEKHTATAHEFR